MATAVATAPRTTPPNPAAERYAQAARSAGLPREQFEVFVRAGIVLQPKQLRFAAACQSCDYALGPTEVGFGGARGGGKSHAGLAILAADCLRFPGLTCLLLRKVGKANRENFEELRVKVLRGVKTQYRRQEGILLFENGSKIILGHFQHESDIDAYLGLEYDVILIEEATTLTSSKYKTIRTCNRSSKPGWRPRMYSTTNPGGVGHAWYKALFIDPYRRRQEKGTRFVPATADDNACLNPEYVRDVLDTLTGWQLRAWRYGDWDIAAGQFFTNWRAEIDGRPHHVIRPFRIPLSWPMWMPLDYGWTHYTSAHLLTMDGDRNLYAVAEYGERKRLPESHAEGLHDMLARHGRYATVVTARKMQRAALGYGWHHTKPITKIVAGHDVFDKPNEDGTFICDTYAALDLPMERANVNRLNGASEILRRLGDVDAPKPVPPSLFVFDTCPRLIECIPALEHDPHRPQDVLKVDCDDDGLGGDDWYDDFRYGCMEAPLKPQRQSQYGASASLPDPTERLAR